MPRAEGKRLSRKRIALLIATAAVLLFIFVQSVFPRSLFLDESETFSEGFLDPIFRLFGLDPLSQTAVRKAAHILEFTALSILRCAFAETRSKASAPASPLRFWMKACNCFRTAAQC